MDNFKVDLRRYAAALCRMFGCSSGQVPLDGFCEYGNKPVDTTKEKIFETLDN